MKPEKLLYKASEARAALGIGLTRFYELVNEGKLDARRMGQRTYVTAASVDAFVKSLDRAVTPTMAADREMEEGDQSEFRKVSLANLQRSPSRIHHDRRVADVKANRRRKRGVEAAAP